MNNIWQLLARLQAKIENPTNLDEAHAAKFRGQQITSVNRVTPVMMTVNVLTAAIVTLALHDKPGGDYIFLWAGMVFLLAVLGMYTWATSTRSNDQRKLGTAVIYETTKVFTLNGLVWGSLAVALYPGGDWQTQLVIVSVMAIMMGAGTLALNFIPSAMIGYLAGIGTPAAAGLILAGTSTDAVLLTLFSIYFISLLAAGLLLAGLITDSRVAAFQVEEQSSTIGLLLREFEESGQDWLWETDCEGNLTRGACEVSDAMETDFGQIFQWIMNDDLDALASKDIVHSGMKDLLKKIDNRNAFTDCQFSVSTEKRDAHWFTLSGKPVYDDAGEFTGFRGVASDITQTKISEERIAFLAHNDALTGLVNRANFTAALERKFNSLTDNPKTFAIMYLDLDGFKLINDVKGHAFGDNLLVEVGKRLKKLIHENDTVARLGGDEFAILIKHPGSAQNLSILAETILEELGQPFSYKDDFCNIGVSIGISIAPVDGKTAESLINAADLALYRAKGEGKGRFRFFEIEMDEIARERRTMEQDLRIAVSDDQFCLHYQPLVDAGKKFVTGFEALIRWQHPERGMIPPMDFIPLAERTGLIVDIGDWVLEEACKTAAGWPGDLTIAVNLSPPQFHKGHIVTSVNSALKRSGLDPHRLELEITEGLFIENTDEVIDCLNELKAMGISTSLDDFGTGYSSLS